MILIIGSPDIHTEHVAAKIRERGGQVRFLDTRQFPAQVALAFNGAAETGLIQFNPAEPPIPLQEIRAVYWYCYEGIQATDSILSMEIESALGSFFRNLDCTWVNHPDAVALHRFKNAQLKRMQSLGCRIPNTLVSNHPETLMSFFEQHGRDVLCKPLFSGFLPYRLQQLELHPEALQRLKQMPVQFQEYISGEDIRVHVVGDQLFPTAILTETSMYKTDPDMRFEVITLPDEIAQLCLDVARQLGLLLAGIDLRRTLEGEYIFFEANPSPQFMIFEQRANISISDALIDLLMLRD